jgi:predicted membrane-bound dolichyl-phosphate-mannose-protein mannosyltransferase
MMKLIKLFFVIIICCVFVIPVIRNRSFYTRKFDYDLLGQKYSKSQYIVGSGSEGIGDDGLYAFAGYYYLNGGDPSQVNFENPPLGKYLIGISIAFFKNENAIYIIYAFFILLTTYLISKFFFKNNIWSLFTVLILCLMRLFQIQYLPVNADQYSMTMLDLPLTVFLLIGIWLMLKASVQPKLYVLANISFGLAFVSKFFPSLTLLIPFIGV